MGFFDMFPKEMVATTIDQSRLESERKAGRDAAIAADEAKKAEAFAKEQRQRAHDHEKFIRNKNYEIKSFLWKRSLDLRDKETERDELRTFNAQQAEKDRKLKLEDRDEKRIFNKGKETKDRIYQKNEDLMKSAIENKFTNTQIDELPLPKSMKETLKSQLSPIRKNATLKTKQEALADLRKRASNGTLVDMPFVDVKSFTNAYKPVIAASSGLEGNKLTERIHAEYALIKSMASKNNAMKNKSNRSSAGISSSFIRFGDKELEVPSILGIEQQINKTSIKKDPISNLQIYKNAFTNFDKNFIEKIEPSTFFKDTNNVNKLTDKLTSLVNAYYNKVGSYPNIKQKSSETINTLFPTIMKAMNDNISDVTKRNLIKENTRNSNVDNALKKPISIVPKVSETKIVAQDLNEAVSNPRKFTIKDSTNPKSSFMETPTYTGDNISSAFFNIDVEKFDQDVKKLQGNDPNFSPSPMALLQVETTKQFNKWYNNGMNPEEFSPEFYENIRTLENSKNPSMRMSSGVLGLAHSIAMRHVDLENQEAKGLGTISRSKIDTTNKVYRYGSIKIVEDIDGNKVRQYVANTEAKTNLTSLKRNTNKVSKLVNRTIDKLAEIEGVGVASTGVVANVTGLFARVNEEINLGINTLKYFLSPEATDKGVDNAAAVKNSTIFNEFLKKLEIRQSRAKELMEQGTLKRDPKLINEGIRIAELASLQIQLAYTMSGMLQGESSGGRTISDNDLKYALLVVGGSPKQMAAKLKTFQRDLDFKKELIDVAIKYDKYGIIDEIDEGIRGYVERREDEINKEITNLEIDEQTPKSFADESSDEWNKNFEEHLPTEVKDKFVKFSTTKDNNILPDKFQSFVDIGRNSTRYLLESIALKNNTVITQGRLLPDGSRMKLPASNLASNFLDVYSRSNPVGNQSNVLLYDTSKSIVTPYIRGVDPEENLYSIGKDVIGVANLIFFNTKKDSDITENLKAEMGLTIKPSKPESKKGDERFDEYRARMETNLKDKNHMSYKLLHYILTTAISTIQRKEELK